MSPIPSSSSVAIPAVPLTRPPGGGPASVTPRCNGWSVAAESWRYASTISGTLDALTEILTRSKSTSSKYAISCIAEATIASGVTPPKRSYSAGSSEPPLTPMRIGTCRSRASDATALMCSGRRMLPGLSRRPVHAGLQRGQRHPVLVVDVGDDRDRRPRHDLGESFGGLGLVARAPDDVATGRGEPVDLLQRALDVGGLGDRHRLHAHRRAAADRHRPDVDLPRRAALAERPGASSQGLGDVEVEAGHEQGEQDHDHAHRERHQPRHVGEVAPAVRARGPARRSPPRRGRRRAGAAGTC